MNHTAVDAVRQEKRWLHQQVIQATSLGAQTAHKAMFTPEQVNAMLRVEMTQDAIPEILTVRDPVLSQSIHNHLTGAEAGPFTIEGVAYYLVVDLGGPAWRVINPMKPPLPQASERPSALQPLGPMNGTLERESRR